MWPRCGPGIEARYGRGTRHSVRFVDETCRAWVFVVLLLLTTGGCASSNGSSVESPAPSSVSAPASDPEISQPSGDAEGLLDGQSSLVGHVRGQRGGYRSLIVVTDAQRSLQSDETVPLIVLAGIGRGRAWFCAPSVLRCVGVPSLAGHVSARHPMSDSAVVLAAAAAQ